MSEKERLQLENECLMKYSKAQIIQKYIDELEESSKLSELWCKSQEENRKLQQENQELKLELSGYRQAILNDKEMLGLKQENQKYKEVIDKITDLIKQYGKYDGEKCTRGFQMWSADFNKILDMLKEVSE